MISERADEVDPGAVIRRNDSEDNVGRKRGGVLLYSMSACQLGRKEGSCLK